jgi:hypothetical protein
MVATSGAGGHFDGVALVYIGRNAIAVDIDRGCRDHSIGHFLPGDNEDFCAWIEVTHVAGNRTSGCWGSFPGL